MKWLKRDKIYVMEMRKIFPVTVSPILYLKFSPKTGLE